MMEIIFINSHPIQYFAPLYKEINQEEELQIKVWYCSHESLTGNTDTGFNTTVKWDIPLLEGYDSELLPNNSWKPSIYNGFWGLLNRKIISKLRKQPKSIVIIHGWAYFTNVAAIIFGKLCGHIICLRAETPWSQEKRKNKLVTFCKHLYLRFLFLFIDRFLFIGNQNKLFYKQLHVADPKLVFTPYCVDNARFTDASKQLNKTEVREHLKLPAEKKIILYSGKYIEKKRPLDLLEAFRLLNDANCYLVMVGEGVLRREMEVYIKNNQLEKNVLLTGFINQSLIPYYYSSADCFVMCSGIGETWGLSVNEAMNFGLPLIVSETCGCVDDLVRNGINGYSYPEGDVKKLMESLSMICNANEATIGSMKQASLNIVSKYNYKAIIEGIKQIA